jgi:hypothetical protein
MGTGNEGVAKTPDQDYSRPREARPAAPDDG